MKLIITFIFAIVFLTGANAQWQKVATGMGINKTVYGLATGNGYVFAGTSDAGIFRSSNNGDNWDHS